MYDCIHFFFVVFFTASRSTTRVLHESKCKTWLGCAFVLNLQRLCENSESAKRLSRRLSRHQKAIKLTKLSTADFPDPEVGGGGFVAVDRDHCGKLIDATLTSSSPLWLFKFKNPIKKIIKKVKKPKFLRSDIKDAIFPLQCLPVIGAMWQSEWLVGIFIS